MGRTPEVIFRDPEQSVLEKIDGYIPPKELIGNKPTLHELNMKAELEESWGKTCKYALVWNESLRKLIFTPPWHRLNTIYPQTPGNHYSHGAFDGESIEPVISKNGDLIGGNLILHRQRSLRFRNSVHSLNLSLPLSIYKFEEAVIDQASILARDILVHPTEGITRAYVRPAAFRVGKFGICPKKQEDTTHISSIMFNWPHYLKKEVYQFGAKVSVFLDQQRTQKILGKHFGNYVLAGNASLISRETGCDESILFGPYIIDDKGEKEYVCAYSDEGKKKLLEKGLLVDGPGEDLIFESRDHRLFIQPEDTNILGGTTRDFVCKMAKHSNIEVEEKHVSIKDIRNGLVIGAAFLGNAVKFAPIRQISLFLNDDNNVGELETILLNIEEAQNLRYLQGQFQDQLSGKSDKYYGQFLTPVDLENGRKAREKLDSIYAPWLE